MAGRQWKDLSRGQQAAVVVLGAIEVGMAVAAWRDLAKRPAELVNGPKAAWAAVIAINVVGPIAYFSRGRRKLAAVGR